VTNLRATAILKTDIGGSTVRFRKLPEADLHALLLEHRELVRRHAAAHEGYIVKPEGDGFWLVFPSVTGAALAAMAMQEELRLAQPNRVEDRLAMRVVIALGDVLHEEGALVGETVVLAARIEAMTPPDEIYLSAAARLAVNQAEVRTALVEAFPMKGFVDPVPVYRVEQTHRTRILDNQYVVFADLRGFGALVRSGAIAATEKILDALYELVNGATRELGGIVRFSAGDAYCVTFTAAAHAMAAAERLAHAWDEFERGARLGCALTTAVHRGTIYAFRSYFYGPAIEVASAVQTASSRSLPPGEGGVFVTGEMRSDLADTEWSKRLRRADVTLRSADIEVYRLAPAIQCP
jgi:class 3 adenylate cyclase